jgi:hypothetical protein
VNLFAGRRGFFNRRCLLAGSLGQRLARRRNLIRRGRYLVGAFADLAYRCRQGPVRPPDHEGRQNRDPEKHSAHQNADVQALRPKCLGVRLRVLQDLPLLVLQPVERFVRQTRKCLHFGRQVGQLVELVLGAQALVVRRNPLELAPAGFESGQILPAFVRGHERPQLADLLGRPLEGALPAPRAGVEFLPVVEIREEIQPPQSGHHLPGAGPGGVHQVELQRRLAGGDAEFLAQCPDIPDPGAGDEYAGQRQRAHGAIQLCR